MLNGNALVTGGKLDVNGSGTDAEVFFGKRHGSKGGGPGALDALINEARIYDIILSPAEIAALVPAGAN